MKKFFLFIAMAVATMAANATTYALFGAVPEGATDLTAKVVAEAQGTAAFAEGVLTGAGLPGRINETSNYLRLSFSEAQDLSLTDEFALHIVLQKADGAAGKVQVSLCNNGWNAARASWKIENADIAADKASDVALKYGDRNTGNWNSFGESNIVGDKTFTNEIMRISAASGEQFTITSIYLESKYESQGGEPIVPPTPEGNVRYYLYRGNNTDALPTIDEVTCIDVRPTANATVSCNSAAQDATVTDYAQFTVNGSWCAIDHKPTAAVTNSIDNTYYLVVRFKTDLADGAVTNNKLRFNLSSGAGNFYINNSDEVTYNDGKWHIVQLALADANGNKPSSYLVANQHAFQIHLDGNGASGKIIAIDYAYFTNDISAIDEGTAADGEIPVEPEVIPEQDPQRIYLCKGSAVTPEGVAVTADYSEGAYLTCEWWNCSVSNEFFGITTSENWWFNMQLKNNAAVDLTPVYSTWRLVIRLRNGVVEDGQDRGLTIEMGEPAANVNLVSTFAEAENFVVKELPLTESLTGAKHLKELAAGANILVMSSGNNNEAGRAIEFDYIYFTNEPESVDPATGLDCTGNTVLDQPVKFINNGQMFIRRGDVIYDLNGQQMR